MRCALPLSSQNPMLTKIIGEQAKTLILNKGRLNGPTLTKDGVSTLNPKSIQTLAINSENK